VAGLSRASPCAPHLTTHQSAPNLQPSRHFLCNQPSAMTSTFAPSPPFSLSPRAARVLRKKKLGLCVCDRVPARLRAHREAIGARCLLLRRCMPSTLTYPFPSIRFDPACGFRSVPLLDRCARCVRLGSIDQPWLRRCTRSPPPPARITPTPAPTLPKLCPYSFRCSR